GTSKRTATATSSRPSRATWRATSTSARPRTAGTSPGRSGTPGPAPCLPLDYRLTYRHRGFVDRELTKLARENPDHLMRMYNDTVRVRTDLLEKTQLTELERRRFDQLELGRRAIGMVAVKQ